MSRILIAVPTYENIIPDTFKAIYQLDKGGNDVDFDFVRGYGVADARNRIALKTIDGGYDFVLTIDNDVVVPRDALVNMLESERSCPLGYTMIVGYCLARPVNASNDSGRTTVFKFGDKGYRKENAYNGKELVDLCNSGVTKAQIRGAGLPCALIHRKVFEQMRYPYFRWTDYPSKERLSEDLYFCEQFKTINTPIYVDTRVSCGHLMRYIDYVER